MTMAVRVLTPSGLKDSSPDEIDDGQNVPAWIDVCGRDRSDLERLRRWFGLHPVAVDNALQAGQRTRLDDLGHHLFFVLYQLGTDPSEDDDEEIAVFLTDRMVITVRDGSRLDVKSIVRRLDEPPEGAGCGLIVWALLDEVVDQYFPVVDALESRIEELEDVVFSEGVDDVTRTFQRRIFSSRKETIRLRRRISPVRDIISGLMTRGQISRDVMPYYQDVYDHILRQTETIDSFRELVASAHDSYLTEVNNDMNRVMKRFTSIGAILVSGTIVTGVYGMNFVHMPELKWIVGYPLALGSMVALMAGLYWWFKRKDWL